MGKLSHEEIKVKSTHRFCLPVGDVQDFSF